MNRCAPRMILLSFLLIEFSEVLSEREHKVHNIVLYPEKHSWCQITPIQQVIACPGYESVTIDNNVCVGACFSYSIPKTQPAEPGELIGPYCDSCQPSGIECYHVNLRGDANNIEEPKIIQKRVQIITNCSCQNCNKVRTEDCQITDDGTVELPHKLLTHDKNSTRYINDDLPDILETNSSPAHHHDSDDVLHKEKHKKWIKNHHDEIESMYRLFLENNKDTNSEIDEGSENYDYTNSEMENFIQKHKSIDSEEHPNDIGLLENVLYLEQNQENNAKIQADLKKVPDNFGIEGVPSGLRGNHIAIGSKQNAATATNTVSEGKVESADILDHPNDIPVSVVNVEERIHHGEKGSHHSHHRQNQGHNHHLGETEYVGLNVVHLIKGPHGSMVAAPVETKLEIDSDALKPNSEGVVIDYGSPHDQPSANRAADLFK
nr:uncharacterized protein LOC111505133 isoform X1 [Leptinotarsa decemlineata]